mgnify:CR=1 FL=1
MFSVQLESPAAHVIDEQIVPLSVANKGQSITCMKKLYAIAVSYVSMLHTVGYKL